jgi:hypothetical protein
VVVAPEYRGRGVGSLMMRGVLQRCADKGYPLTALYPATTVLYRHLGYEFAGNRYKFSFQAADLRTLGGKGTSVRKAGRADADLFLELAGKNHAARRSSGPLIWPRTEVESWLEDEDNFAYVADDGFVVYNWSDGDQCRGLPRRTLDDAEAAPGQSRVDAEHPHGPPPNVCSITLDGGLATDEIDAPNSEVVEHVRRRSAEDRIESGVRGGRSPGNQPGPAKSSQRSTGVQRSQSTRAAADGVARAVCGREAAGSVRDRQVPVARVRRQVGVVDP